MYYWKSLKNNLTKANTEFDRNIAHELTHNVMVSNMNPYVYTSLPSFIREGIAELTHGLEKENESDIKNLAKNSSLLSQSLVLDTDGVTVSGIKNPSYAGGFIFLRYLARQAGDLTVDNKTANKTVRTFYGNDTIESEGNNVTIDSGAGNDRISIYGGSNISINSGTGADYVAVGSEENKVTISSGTGNDYINNWSSQAKIYTAEGSDTVYNSSLASNAYISTGAGNDSIENNGAKATIDGGTGNDSIQNDGNNASIVCGAGNDSVWSYGSKVTISGEAGNDTLWGGAGNDSLWGGDGKDTFIYKSGEGKDVIFGFENNDLLKITGTFSVSYNESKGEVYFKVGSTNNAITLKDFTATTLHVNNKTYTLD